MKKIYEFIIELTIILLLMFCAILIIGLFVWGIIDHPIITVSFLILLIVYCIIEDKFTKHKYQNIYKDDLQKLFNK